MKNSAFNVSDILVPYYFGKNYDGTMIVCEAPGADEEKEKTPLVGSAGEKFNGWLENLEKSRKQLILANVFRYRPQNNKVDHFFCSAQAAKANKLETSQDFLKYNGKMLLKHFEGEIHYLHKIIVEEKPQHVIAMGNVALWALAGLTKITLHRGTVHTKTFEHNRKTFTTKLHATFHPASCLYNPDHEEVILSDLKQAWHK